MARQTYIKGSTVTLAEFLDEDYLLYYETWLDPETRRKLQLQRQLDQRRGISPILHKPGSTATEAKCLDSHERSGRRANQPGTC